MIADYRPATLEVISDDGSITSREAVSLGLIVTELIRAPEAELVVDRWNRRVASCEVTDDGGPDSGAGRAMRNTWRSREPLRCGALRLLGKPAEQFLHPAGRPLLDRDRLRLAV
jgi:hypothetical protein